MGRFESLVGAVYGTAGQAGSERADGDGDTADGPFDPGAANVKDVLAYMEAHPDDAQRVREAESEGKARQGILDA